MDTKKPNKIKEIVRLQQLVKRWRKLACSPKSSGKKGLNFLKRTLSFSDSSKPGDVPKGHVAVSVGKEMKRFIIPTDYLHHYPLVDVLKEAEEEFGFQNEGVLRIPCDADAFEKILRAVNEVEGDGFFVNDDTGCKVEDQVGMSCGSQAADGINGLACSHSHHKPICR